MNPNEPKPGKDTKSISLPEKETYNVQKKLGFSEKEAERSRRIWRGAFENLPEIHLPK